MSGAARIYLDNAATSFPKPPAVLDAVQSCLRDNGTAYGRGTSRGALESQRIVDRCRERAARLLGAPDPQHVVFTFNGTDSLNLAIQGLLREGNHVVTTTWEHNSVLRPLKALEKSRGVTTTVIGPGAGAVLDREEFSLALARAPRLVILNHASNVTGRLAPVEELISLTKRSGAFVLVDVAQSAGHVPVDHLMNLGADVLACPGHKGLLGPLGTGLVALRAGVDLELQPIRQGGTGTTSESEEQPITLPDRYESGNHNVPGLWGLEAGLEWIEQQGLATLRAHEVQLTDQLLQGLKSLPRVIVYGDGVAEERVGVVSFNVEGIEPQVVASILEQHFHVEGRAGLHCAPRAHLALGTTSLGGSVRLSPGPLTTSDEIDQALEAIGQIVVAM